MNERILELMNEAAGSTPNGDSTWEEQMLFMNRFAELIIEECVRTLEFHGFDDAIPYVKWMATNKLGQDFGVK